MIRIMIIDDEFLVRERIKKCLDWNTYGFEIVGEASNGEDALRTIEELLPQIAITDISMPYIDGLEFAKVVQKKYPEMKVVILTGYSSFDYARGALHAGVTNYLLKPINKQELENVMLELKAKIENEKQVKEYVQNLKINSTADFILKKEETLKTIIESDGITLNPSMIKKFKEYYPYIIEIGLMVILIEVDYYLNPDLKQEDRELWRYAVLNIFNEDFENYSHFESSYDMQGNVILLVNVHEDHLLQECYRLCEKAWEHLQEFLKLTVTIGIGNIHNGLKGMVSSYKEAKIALKNKLILGGNQIIRYESLKPYVGSAEVNVDMRRDMLIHLRLGESALIKAEVHRIFKHMIHEKMPVQNLYIIVSELLLIVIAFAKEKEINIGEIIGESFEVNAFIEDKESLWQVEEYFLQIVDQLLNKYNEEHLFGYTNFVGKVKNYIDLNYANKELSLKTIASNMAINDCYLSTLFKREAGISVIEYLTECRMKTAKELLLKGDNRLVEISEMVGFNDPYYFSKCFKKMTGISPSKYAKK